MESPSVAPASSPSPGSVGTVGGCGEPVEEALHAPAGPPYRLVRGERSAKVCNGGPQV